MKNDDTEDDNQTQLKTSKLKTKSSKKEKLNVKKLPTTNNIEEMQKKDNNSSINVYEVIKPMVVGKRGYVYVFSNITHSHYGEHVYKIGQSIDCEKRVIGYSYSHIDPSIIVYKSPLLLNCALAEQLVFKELSKYRMRKNGEHFQCPIEIIKKTIDEVSKKILTIVDVPYQGIIYTAPPPTPTPILPSVPILKVYKCKHCKNNFTTQYDLRKHSKACKEEKLMKYIEDQFDKKLIASGIQQQFDRYEQLLQNKRKL